MTTTKGVRLLLLVALIGGTAFASGGFGGNEASEHEDGEAYAIGLWGDLPYSTVQATARRAAVMPASIP